MISEAEEEEEEEDFFSAAAFSAASSLAMRFSRAAWRALASASKAFSILDSVLARFWLFFD